MGMGSTHCMVLPHRSPDPVDIRGVRQVAQRAESQGSAICG